MTTPTRPADWAARLRLVEHSVELLRSVQVLDRSSLWYGGFRDPLRLVAEPWYAANGAETMVAAWVEPRSRYFLDPNLLISINLALDYLLRNQYANGTIDAYFVGDMQAAPNVAFVARTLCRMHRRLSECVTYEKTAALSEQIQKVQGRIELFLARAGQAIVQRRVYTSNHRWVAADALLQINALLPNEALVQRAHFYLQQGIDIDADGMYSERSTSYGMLTNRTLISIGELLGDERYFDYVRRNLEFVLHLVQPNGEDAYQFSRRQDAVAPGLQVGGAEVFRYMARRTGDGRLASMADLLDCRGLTEAVVEATIAEEQHSWTTRLPDDECRFPTLKHSLLNSIAARGELLSEWARIDISDVPREPLPSVFDRHYPAAKIVRVRAENVAATLMGMQPNFISLHGGDVVLEGMRILYLYHNWKSFQPVRFEPHDQGGYVLYGSHAHNPQGPKFPEEDKDLTLRVHLQYEDAATWSIRLTTEGQKMIPLQIEFALRPTGTICVGGRSVELKNRAFYFAHESFSVKGPENQLCVWGLPKQMHRFVNERDAWLGNIPMAKVLATAFTPCDLTMHLHIRPHRSENDCCEILMGGDV